ncbi:MAG: SCO family protein [Sedimenticola sp.]|nr:SCO family protein [Sedimenticola sp.]
MRKLLKYLALTALGLINVGNASGAGGNFSLIADNGTPYSLSDSRGNIVVLSFGYTFCPDVCPTGLATISSALNSIGEAAQQIDALFISVDPDRDTPETLAKYTRYFHPRLTGLTGHAESIADVARRYYARFEFVGKGETPNYTIDHTASFYIIDRNGQLINVLPHSVPPDSLAESLLVAVRQPVK